MITSLFSMSVRALRWGGILPGQDSLYIFIIAYASTCSTSLNGTWTGRLEAGQCRGAGVSKIGAACSFDMDSMAQNFMPWAARWLDGQPEGLPVLEGHDRE
ncbi:MAG: hypothetical protein NTV80_07240 [Verrucomicrobia bacterium]|nr:hypothetical protein [Verrucomicrobiota bacterium]